MKPVPRRTLASAILLVLCLFAGATTHAASYQLQGQSRGSTNWIGGNLQNWRELDYIPCRVYITGGPLNNQIIRITFPHLTGTTPGFENLINFTPSPNAIITTPPVLTTPASGDWTYTFTVTVTNNSPAWIGFTARLAAGAHLNTGSSLALSGFPSSMGNLQIHKPSAGPGAPDLVLVKTGPPTAQPGQIITYSIFYTNIATATPSTGTQVSDILPPELTVLTNTLPTNSSLVGHTIFWDRGTLLPGVQGQISFQAQITPAAVAGQRITNYAQILSAENDVNYANNASTFITTIIIPCVGASIAGQPLSQSVCLGEPVTLSVAANGSSPLGYQWRKVAPGAPVALPGETNSALVLPAVTAADFGGYDVIVTNSCGAVTSLVATVTLYNPVTVTPLISQTNCPGATVTFTTTTAAELPVSFEWFKNGDLLEGQMMSSLTLSNITVADAGLYTVLVSGGCYVVTNSATLTVEPFPTILCATNKTVESGTAWTFDEPTTSSGTLTLLSTTTNTGCGNTLSATRTWRLVDSCGNAAQCSQTVTVVDTTAPLITCAAHRAVECGSGWSFDPPTLTEGTLTVVGTVTNLAGCSYSVTRTWRATDACGNNAQCSQTISVVDTTAPLLTCLAAKAVEAGAPFAFDLPAVNDACSTNAISIVTTVTNLSGCSYSVTRTWRATDACGNNAQCSQTLSVVDTTAPLLTCLAAKAVEAGAPFAFDLPSVNDACSTNAISIVSTVTNLAGCSYSVTRTWRATDACGNNAQCSQTISVTDTTAPTITIISPTNNAFYIAPATITLVADAFDASGPVDKVEFYIGTNKVGEALSAPYSITLSNVAPGVYPVVAATADACANAAASAAISVTVLDQPPLSIVGAMHFNPQTGLFEQTVRVFNPTGSEYEAVRVYIGNLATNVVVYNRSGITNGLPYVQSGNRVLPGTYVDLLIEYYVPTRVAPNPTLVPQLVPLSPGGIGSVVGNGQNIERGVMLPNSTFLLEFSTTAGRTYYIQYSSDLVNWLTAQQPITGNGSRVQWIDNGQPKTVSAPSDAPYRFYRLVVVP